MIPKTAAESVLGSWMVSYPDDPRYIAVGRFFAIFIEEIKSVVERDLVGIAVSFHLPHDQMDPRTYDSVVAV